MEELILTPSALLDLLLQIDELKDKDIGITETLDGNLQLQINDTIYTIESDDIIDIPTDVGTVETITDVKDAAYDELEDSGQIETKDSIESGIIGSLAKSLFIGGMARLTADILKK